MMSLISYLVLTVSAAPTPVRVAIIDRLQSQTLSSEKYERDYLLGIELGKQRAHEHGIEIEWKYFELSKEPIATLEILPEVLKWNPDIIIGPRSSNRFLLLKDQLKDIFVISPLATAEAVDQMPKNFYSLSYPNRFATEALVNFVFSELKPKGIHAIVESECKNCSDFADHFSERAAKKKKSLRLSRASFATAAVETVPMAELLKGYQIGDPILLPNTSYSSGVLAARISDHLNRSDIIFLGNDEWGSWDATSFGRIQSLHNVKGMLIIPWSIESAGPIAKIFSDEMAKRQKKWEPSERIALITFSVMVAIETILSDPRVKKASGQDLKAQILRAFEAMKAKNPYPFRSDYFSVIKYEKTGSSFVKKIQVPRQLR